MNLMLTAALGAAALIAAVVVVAWGVTLGNLRGAARTIRKAEELKTVDLSSVITAYVPIQQRTNVPGDEIKLAKATIAQRLRSTSRTFQLSTAVLILLAGANLWIHTWGAPRPPPGVRQTSVGIAPPIVDALSAVPGTWGWKYNALLSCKENPHTISFSNDQLQVSIRFKTPLSVSGGTIIGYDYDILRTGPSELVLTLVNGPARTDSMGRPLEWSMHFDSKDSYYLKRSDVATQDTGVIVRCSL